MQKLSTQPPGRRQTSLIVEDSTFDQQMMARVVHRSQPGMLTEFAPSLRTARVALASRNVSLILLDNNLPDGVGANFALELAAETRLSQIPVIIVSDWPSPFMWEKAASAGVQFIVDKSEFGARHITEVMDRVRSKRRRAI